MLKRINNQNILLLLEQTNPIKLFCIQTNDVVHFNSAKLRKFESFCFEININNLHSNLFHQNDSIPNR